MATFLEHTYSIVRDDSTGTDHPSLQELKTQLEKGDDTVKISAMKSILTVSLPPPSAASYVADSACLDHAQRRPDATTTHAHYCQNLPRLSRKGC